MSLSLSRIYCGSLMSACWFLLELNAILIDRVLSWQYMTHLCVSWLSHTNDTSIIESICRRQNKSARKIKIDHGNLEEIVKKGDHAVYHHFFLFPQCFQKPSSLGSFKIRMLSDKRLIEP